MLSIIAARVTEVLTLFLWSSTGFIRGSNARAGMLARCARI